MGRVRVHCYGCSAAVEVDDDLPGPGLRVAGWSVDHGQTYCPTCAHTRGLPDPRGLAPSRPGSVGQADDSDSGSLEATAGGTWATTPNVSVPPGPAIGDPDTSDALARYRRHAWLWVLAAAAVLVATAVVGAVQSDRASQLLKAGAHTPGIVVAYQYGRGGADIVVQYMPGATPRQAVINLPDSNSGYAAGDPVDVIYDPSDPGRVRTAQDANESRTAIRLLVYGVVISIGLAMTAIQSLRRPRRWRRLLRAHEWSAYASTYIPAQRRRSGPGVKLTPLHAGRAEPVALRLAGTLPQRAARLAGQTVVWVAGDPMSEVVVAIPRSRELFSALPPRGYIGRRWSAAQKRPTSRWALGAARVYRTVAVAVGLLGLGSAVYLQRWALAAGFAVQVAGTTWALKRARGARPGG